MNPIVHIDNLAQLKPGKHYLLIGPARWNLVEWVPGEFKFTNAREYLPNEVSTTDTHRVFQESEVKALIEAGMMYIDTKARVTLDPRKAVHR